MIGFFPEIYPDELLYSQLSRYYQRSGHLAYIYVADELFQNKFTRPSVELVNLYTNDAYSHICGNQEFDSIIMQHTMFSNYARFLPKERRIKAYKSMLNMRENEIYNNVLIPKGNKYTKRYLRYCPICLAQDRRSFGEGYWHRFHQLIGIDICPEHHCRLIDGSDVVIGKSKPALVTLESCVKTTPEPEYKATEIEKKIANYINETFQSRMNFQNDISPSQLFVSKLSCSEYASSRGQKRNMETIVEDFLRFYKDLPNNTLNERFKIERLLNGDRMGTYDVGIFAYFLGMEPSELTNITLCPKRKSAMFDEKVRQLHAKGLNTPKICEIVGASRSTVQKLYRQNQIVKPLTPLKSKPKRSLIDWEKYDKEMLPKVKTAIMQLLGSTAARPKRITVNSVKRLMGLPDKRIDKMPLCRTEIIKYYETQEEYWARELAWAYENAKPPITQKKLIAMTNVRKSNLIKSLQFLYKHTTVDNARKIENIILK